MLKLGIQIFNKSFCQFNFWKLLKHHKPEKGFNDLRAFSLKLSYNCLKVSFCLREDLTAKLHMRNNFW